MSVYSRLVHRPTSAPEPTSPARRRPSTALPWRFGTFDAQGYPSTLKPFGDLDAKPQGQTNARAQQERLYVEFMTEYKSMNKEDQGQQAESEKRMVDLVQQMDNDTLLRLERAILVLLQPRMKSEHISRAIAIVRSRVVVSDDVEAARSKHSEDTGLPIEERLQETSKTLKAYQCLNYLYHSALPEVYGDDPRLAAAKSAYVKGAMYRVKTERSEHAGFTLSRLASELRLQGLVGPVNILNWKGPRFGGHHEPDPVELFERLSSAGDGWYFFLVSLVSDHTLLVAVHVEGGERKFHVNQAGGSWERDASSLRATFNDRSDGNPNGAASRIWQVYSRPM